ncbi:MAG: T9SS type A sorting domain-containing protein [Saprospiraceae bacterium]|nr:T9SS type A sorting domain-containing protein [Saprospiraceae bacterium]
MRQKLLLFALLFFTYQWGMSQEIIEDFEDGGKLVWVAGDGVYNGIIENPDTAGINNSLNVGSYTKAAGRGFSLFRVQQMDPFDISVNHVWKMQVWSPVETEVLLKLEGGGNAVEDRKSIQDSAWTELTFDFSSRADAMTMTDLLIFFSPGNADDSSTYLFDNITANPFPEAMVWEDFEDGPKLDWEARNGIFTGVVENPDTTGLNKSLNVGSYTKSDSHAFSLFIHEQMEPFDMSLLNKVSIQIYSPVKTEFILKLEGSGEAKEVRSNIPTANVWREYVMDFSDAADMTTLTKIILFFDPGVAESGDTYLFDNLIALPNDECAGTEPLPGYLDNFECQRNVTYDNGWDRLTVADNPDLSLVNETAKVGCYSKPENEAWATLMADFDNRIDLTELNALNVKIWSPVVDRVLFKLEGGGSPAREIFIDILEANTWVDYVADFSEYANEDHKRVGIFPAAGTAFDSAVIFYFDEIKWTLPPPKSSILEDFEDGPDLVWLPLDNDMGNGEFEVIDNPDMGDANPSMSVGSYTRGANAFSTLSVILTDPLDLSENAQFNLDIWAPEEASSVTMQLSSPVEGLKEVTRDIDATGMWTTVSFDFSSSSMITDFNQINFIFDAESSISGPYYLDNLSQGETTVDPCEGIEADPQVVDDFECQRNVDITIGADDLEVSPNPDISPENQSSVVGKYTEPDGNFASLAYNYGDDNPIDLSLYNQLNIKIWAPRAVPILFKLEGGDGVQEVFVDVSEAEKWVNYQIDFSESVGKGHTRLILFFNAGMEATIGEEYFLDDISWGLPPTEACIVNFEGEPGSPFNPTGWIYFANGTFADSTLHVVANPAPDAVNGTENVGRFVESAGVGDGSDMVQRFAGVFIRGLNAINFVDPNNQNITMDVWMDHEANVGLKVEGGQTIANTPNNLQPYTTPNQWQTITWNFGDLPNDQWTVVSLIFDFDNIPAENKVYYFDNIRVTGTSCDATTSIFDVEIVPSFSISPNPATEFIQISAPEDFDRIDIMDVMGRVMSSVKGWFNNTSQFAVSYLNEGVYFINIYDQNKVIGNAKFIKN